MRTLPIAVACVFALSPVAKADKFWLESPDTKHSAEGSLPAVIEGVLLDEDAQNYHLRVVGGEIWLAKSRVVKIDKDALTAADIQKQESDQAPRLLAADQERQQAQLAAARAREAAGKPVEAALRTTEVTPVPAALPPLLAFDPVVGAVLPVAPVSHGELLRDVALIYQQTHDPAYVKMLRQLRRLN